MCTLDSQARIQSTSGRDCALARCALLVPEERLPLCPPEALGQQRVGAHPAFPARAPPPGQASSRRSSLQARAVHLGLGEGDPKHRENPPETVGGWGPRAGPETWSVLAHFFSGKAFPGTRSLPSRPTHLPGSLPALFAQFQSQAWKSPNRSPLCPHGTEQNSQQTGFCFSQPLKVKKKKKATFIFLVRKGIREV